MADRAMTVARIRIATRKLLKVLLATAVLLGQAAFWGLIALAIWDESKPRTSSTEWTGIFSVLIPAYLGMPWNFWIHDVYPGFEHPFVAGIAINYAILLGLSIIALRWVFQSSTK